MIVCVEFEWKNEGPIELDRARKIKFPQFPNVPGIYQITLTDAKRTSVYIGETDNLRRRAQNYRTPGPTQHTSIRVNKKITMILANGGAVRVAVAEGASLVLDGKPAVLDLHQRASRRLLENAALVVATAGVVEAVENL